MSEVGPKEISEASWRMQLEVDLSPKPNVIAIH